MNLLTFLRHYNGYLTILVEFFDNFCFIYSGFWDNDCPGNRINSDEFSNYEVTEFVINNLGSGLNVYVREYET